MRLYLVPGKLKTVFQSTETIRSKVDCQNGRSSQLLTKYKEGLSGKQKAKLSIPQESHEVALLVRKGIASLILLQLFWPVPVSPALTPRLSWLLCSSTPTSCSLKADRCFLLVLLFSVPGREPGSLIPSKPYFYPMEWCSLVVSLHPYLEGLPLIPTINE